MCAVSSLSTLDDKNLNGVASQFRKWFVAGRFQFSRHDCGRGAYTTSKHSSECLGFKVDDHRFDRPLTWSEVLKHLFDSFQF